MVMSKTFRVTVWPFGENVTNRGSNTTLGHEMCFVVALFLSAIYFSAQSELRTQSFQHHEPDLVRVLMCEIKLN
jgi:hypothetical protein